MIMISSKKGNVTRATLAEALNAYREQFGTRGTLTAAAVEVVDGLAVQPWDAWCMRGTFKTISEAVAHV